LLCSEILLELMTTNRVLLPPDVDQLDRAWEVNGGKATSNYCFGNEVRGNAVAMMSKSNARVPIAEKS